MWALTLSTVSCHSCAGHKGNELKGVIRRSRVEQVIPGLFVSSLGVGGLHLVMALGSKRSALVLVCRNRQRSTRPTRSLQFRGSNPRHRTVLMSRSIRFFSRFFFAVFYSGRYAAILVRNHKLFRARSVVQFQSESTRFARILSAPAFANFVLQWEGWK